MEHILNYQAQNLHESKRHIDNIRNTIKVVANSL